MSIGFLSVCDKSKVSPVAMLLSVAPLSWNLSGKFLIRISVTKFKTSCFASSHCNMKQTYNGHTVQTDSTLSRLLFGVAAQLTVNHDKRKLLLKGAFCIYQTAEKDSLHAVHAVLGKGILSIYMCDHHGLQMIGKPCLLGKTQRSKQRHQGTDMSMDRH